MAAEQGSQINDEILDGERDLKEDAGMSPDENRDAGDKKAKESDKQEKKSPKNGSAKGKEINAQAEAALKEAQEENAGLKDQLLRKQADFDNFRKRMLREKEEAITYANSLLLQDLITIIDDFERAIKSSEESRDFDALHSGVELIEKQLSGMLERKYGLKRMESLGEEFDPEKHEALAVQEIDDFEKQVVLEDYLKGYTLNGRILRHAKVKVAGPVTKKKED